jgi:hypothetical protein
MSLLTVTEYLSHKWQRICSSCGSHNLVISSFMTYHCILTGESRRVLLMDQELLAYPKHLIYSQFLLGSCCPIFNFLCTSLFLFFSFFSFGHYFVHTSIYGFWLSLCCPYFYLRFLITIMLSILLFTVSHYHYVVHTSIYGFWLPLCCPYFYLRFLITIMLSILLFT